MIKAATVLFAAAIIASTGSAKPIDSMIGTYKKGSNTIQVSKNVVKFKSDTCKAETDLEIATIKPGYIKVEDNQGYGPIEYFTLKKTKDGIKASTMEQFFFDSGCNGKEETTKFTGEFLKL